MNYELGGVEPKRTTVTISINGKEIITPDTKSGDGRFFDHRLEESAVFDTDEGTLLVDFSEYEDRAPHAVGYTGVVFLQGEALISSGHSARRKNSETLKGRRKIQTGYRFEGAEVIGKDERGQIRTVSIRLH